MHCSCCPFFCRIARSCTPLYAGLGTDGGDFSENGPGEPRTPIPTWRKQCECLGLNRDLPGDPQALVPIGPFRSRIRTSKRCGVNLFHLITAPTSDIRTAERPDAQPELRGGRNLSRHDVAVNAMKEQRITAGLFCSDSWKCCQAINNVSDRMKLMKLMKLMKFFHFGVPAPSVRKPMVRDPFDR